MGYFLAAPGSWPDFKIFRSNLKNRLAPREKLEADNGYQGEPTAVRTPNTAVSDADKRAKTRARAQHETINKRFKHWGCLKQTFRHDLRKHEHVFAAVAVCTQLCFEHGKTQFQRAY
jgi:hypothetical protein